MAILLATVLFFCGVATALVITNVMDVKDAASWAQAVGGFLAIVAAFLIGNAQSKASVAAVGLTDRLTYARKCNALLAVAAELADVSKKAFDIYQSKDIVAIQLYEGEWTLPLDTLLDELTSIRAHEFGEKTVLTAVISLKVSSSYLKNMLGKMPDAIVDIDTDGNWNKFNRLLDVIDINRKLIEEASDALNERLRHAQSSHIQAELMV
jgi:hypothetical protein